MLILPRRGHDYTIKPPQWGPLSSVESNARHQFDKMGLPHPVLHWSFWEAAGGVAWDVSSYGNHGTMTGGPTWLGKSVSFDGSDDRIISGTTSFSIANHEPFTLYVIFRKEITGNRENLLVCLSDSDEISARISYAGDLTNKRHTVEICNDGSCTSIYGVPGETWGDNNFLGQWEHIVLKSAGGDPNIFSYYFNGEYADSANRSNRTSIDKIVVGANADGTEAWKGLIDSVFLSSENCTADQIALLYERPYQPLYYEPRPLIFDLAAGSTTVAPVNLSAETSVASAPISLIRLLGLENASVSTQVTALTIGLGVKQLTGLDVSSDSTVTAASIQAVRAILESNVSTATEVTNLAVQVARACGLDDVASQTQVASAAMSVVRAILTGGVSSSTEVTDAALNVVRQLQLSGVSSATEVTQVAVTTAGTLGIQDVSSQTQVAAVALQVLRQLQETGVSSDTEVTEVALQAIRAVTLSDVSSATEVSSVAISAAETLGIADVSVLSTIASIALSVTRAIGPLTVEVSSAVDDVVISALRAVFLGAVSISTEVGAATISVGAITVPSMRLVVVEAENRIVVVEAENRIVEVT